MRKRERAGWEGGWPGPLLSQPQEPIKPHPLLISCEPLLSLSLLKRVEADPFLLLSLEQEGVGAFPYGVAPVSAAPPYAPLPLNLLELGLGTEDREGESGDSGDLGKPHCFQK